ncbi:PREDICTED: uncharacterized protein LOC104802813 [Tarenaya hassleriana]|uniref:uncharacterized protein LOC104802813 n=1 Tax=Tarenaya hassleriana TaxID=28532 RepID=UPI00053C8778|nr:PREDICTED: uncharacterized protein LOC104802813 [Tarenaya hassleriana]
MMVLLFLGAVFLIQKCVVDGLCSNYLHRWGFCSHLVKFSSNLRSGLMAVLTYNLAISSCSNSQTYLRNSYYGNIVASSETGISSRKALEQVDKELSRGDERAALGLVKDLQGKPGGLCCFGAARQVPQRLYTLDELKLNGINTMSLLSPTDATLDSVERNLQIAAVSGGLAAWKGFDLSPQQILFLSLGSLFLWTLDLVSFNGGIGSLVLDTIGHTFSQRYHNRVIQHEAGHFLVAYLVGILPRGYTLSSLEALQEEGTLNIQAGTAFVDYEFLEEVNAGKVSATMLNRFSCIALAGVATEYLLYGYAEGGLADINKLDVLLKSLGFTQKKADSQVRWSVLNTILILRRHEMARSKLAEAMSEGKSVGSCIGIIEDTIDHSDI